MYPRPFEYSRPVTLDEAIADLAAAPGARVLAGGMSLIPMMKLKVLAPPAVVDIGRVAELGVLKESDNQIEVGPVVRQHEIAANRTLARRATALAEAAAWTGDPQVRNRGTLCGSLAHADPSADQPAAVLALAGTLEARGVAVTRTIAAVDFFVDAFATALEADEILAGVTIPLSSPGEGSAYRKVGRRGGHSGFPIAASAAWVRLQDGIVSDARVALTSVSTRPVLAGLVAQALIGSDGSPGAVDAAAALASEGIEIIPDLHGPAEYKAHLATVLTARALKSAIARARTSYEKGS